MLMKRLRAWIAPIAIVVGLVGLGLVVRALWSEPAAPEAQDVAEAHAQLGSAAGASGPEHGEREGPEEATAAGEPLTWDEEHHPKAPYPSDVASAAALRTPIAERPLEHPEDDLVTIPGGELWMGDDSVPCARPRLRVSVRSFRIGRYEVTQARYQRFVEGSSYRAPDLDEDWARDYRWQDRRPRAGTEREPIVLVDFHDAAAFCAWLGQRLPTEAEWEAAARGVDARRWPWGDVWDGRKSNTVERLSGPLKTHPDYVRWLASASASEANVRPAPIGSFPEDRSPYGVMDLHGNVAEWVNGAFEPYAGGNRSESPLFGRADVRVTRGTNFGHFNYASPAATRFPYPANHRDSTVGFRCAADLR